MPASFTGQFTGQLAEASAIRVKEAEVGEALRPGMLYVCPGSHHLRISAAGNIQLDDGPLIRATLIGLPGLDTIGRRVQAQWVVARTDSDGNEVVEPRFAVVSDNGPAGGAS